MTTPRKKAAANGAAPTRAPTPPLSPAASTLLAQRARLETLRQTRVQLERRLYSRLKRAWNRHADALRLLRCTERSIGKIDAQLKGGGS